MLLPPIRRYSSVHLYLGVTLRELIFAELILAGTNFSHFSVSTAKISSAKYDFYLKSVKTPREMKEFRQKVGVNRGN